MNLIKMSPAFISIYSFLCLIIIHDGYIDKVKGLAPCVKPILEIIPIIGPIISAVPSVLVALTVSPGLALAVIALYIIVQQLENNLIVPAVMRQAVGLPPLASLLALMIGGRLAGTIGIVLAVPMLLVIQTLIQEFLLKGEKIGGQ